MKVLASVIIMEMSWLRIVRITEKNKVMKANEAPEKIYLTTDGNNSFVFTQKRSDNKGIEYTRTDAFIEKAAEYLANKMRCNGYTLQTKAKFIRDFKKYMED